MRKKKSKWTRKKNESFVNYLMRVCNANWIQVLIGIVGLVLTTISIWLIWPPKENELKRTNREINEKISWIKTNVRPKMIIEVNDSLGELVLIKNFQMAVLEYVHQYEAIEKASIHLITPKDSNINKVITQYIGSIVMMEEQRIKINNCLSNLMSLSIQHSIEDYYMLSLAKILDNNKLTDDLLVFYKKEITLINKYQAKQNINKIIETVELLHTSLDNKRMINSTLSYIMQANNIIAIRLNKKIK